MNEIIENLHLRDREADLDKLAVAFFENLQRNEHCEYGGWGLDDKRPFGNSYVTGDLIEIIFVYDLGEKNINTFDELWEDDSIAEYVTGLYDDLGNHLKNKCLSLFRK